MVPHALFVPSDRSVDLALNLLTFAVVGALLAAMVALVYSWLHPIATVQDRGDVGPPIWAAMSGSLIAPPTLDLDLVPLAKQASIYRCEHLGEVTYTDRPCLAGRARTLTVRPL